MTRLLLGESGSSIEAWAEAVASGEIAEVGGSGVRNRHSLHPDVMFLERRFERRLENGLEGGTRGVQRVEREMEEEVIVEVVLERRRADVGRGAVICQRWWLIW